MKISEFPAVTSSLSEDKLLIEQNGIFKHVNKANFLAELNNASGRLANWVTFAENLTARAGDRIISNNATTDITITLPASPVAGNEIEIINVSGTFKTNFLFNNVNLDAQTTVNRNISLKGQFNYLKLVYLNATAGWVQIPQKVLTSATPYPSGMRLLLEFGSLQDQSGLNNHAYSLSGVLPQVVNGLNNQKVLRFSGAGNQELEVPYFLAQTTAATLYCVFTVSVNSNYTLVRTAALDDYWRFINDGNGYFGTFLSARRDSYPLAMPSSGSHLVSIHASATNYEVILDKVSKGVVSNAYSSGNRFRIATDDKPFTGDIALILVYPSLIAKTSTIHASILSLIKANYPSLPFN